MVVTGRVYRAIDIARANGQTSDRWTRNKRQLLDEMLMTCHDGQRLVDSLRVPVGYSQMAADLISLYVQSTSAMVPVVLDGELQKNANGVVLLRPRSDDDQMRLTDDQFQELLWIKFGKADPEPEPEREPERAEFPGGTLISTRIDFQARSDQTPIVAEILDNTAVLSGDTSHGLAGMMRHILSADYDQGRTFGALRAQTFAAGMQQSMNTAIESMAADVAPQQQSASVERKSKKQR